MSTVAGLLCEAGTATMAIQMPDKVHYDVIILGSGLGGAMLDTPEELAENRAALGASDSSPSTDFGYMVWDKSDGVWSGTLFDSHGKPTKSHCELKERALHCDH